jgi:hypothetical protein
VSVQWLAIPIEVVDAVYHDPKAAYAVVWLYRHSARLKGAPFQYSSRMAQKQWRMGSGRVEALLDRLIALGVVEVVKAGGAHSARWLRVLQ